MELLTAAAASSSSSAIRRGEKNGSTSAMQLVSQTPYEIHTTNATPDIC